MEFDEFQNFLQRLRTNVSATDGIWQVQDLEPSLKYSLINFYELVQMSHGAFCLCFFLLRVVIMK